MYWIWSVFVPYLNWFFLFVLGMLAPPSHEAQGPSAPPANMFDVLPGYEGTMAGGGTVNV